jgi:8-oxo-dGTP diphosphatase
MSISAILRSLFARRESIPLEYDTVVAGIISDGKKILICQRSRDDPQHPLKWEFPGGKVEDPEFPEQALFRELFEELDIVAQIGELIHFYPFSYPDRKPIYLLFYDIPGYKGQMKNCAFEEIKWVPFDELDRYDFLDGDRSMINLLVRKSIEEIGEAENFFV